MKRQPNGSLLFQKTKKTPIFIFTKHNYDSHCLRRPRLKQREFLQEIEKTLYYPECITRGAKKNQRTYYRVLKNIHNKYNIEVYVLKIPTFPHRKNKRVFIISTAFDFWAYNWQVIHNLEKIIWKRRNSLLF